MRKVILFLTIILFIPYIVNAEEGTSCEKVATHDEKTIEI